MVQQATQTLNGSQGIVFLDGEEVGVVTQIEATVTFNYEDIFVGKDKDRKLVSQEGSGTLSFQPTRSTSAKIAQKYSQGKEPRFVIEAELSDPSAIDGGVESRTLNNVSFDSAQIMNWSVGAVVTNDLPFKFTPSDVQYTSDI